MLVEQIKEHLEVFNRSFTAETLSLIADVGAHIADAFENNGKVILFGNGGSAADSQHISAEFISKLSKDRSPLRSLALTVDTSAITAISNDYGYDQVFARQLRALCNPQDIVIGISTSGKSRNVILGLEVSNEIGAKTIGLTGANGISDVKVDYEFAIPSDNTARIQEMHIVLGHLICSEAERNYV